MARRPTSARLASAFLSCLVALGASLLLACASDEERLQEHLAQGDSYREEEKYAEAIIEYKNVLKIDPNNAQAHFGLADAFLRTSRLRQGYWELREAVRLDPSNAAARLQYGHLSRLAGELEEALAQADAVIEIDPDRPAAYLLRGQSLDGLKRYDEAQISYEEAVERFPEDPAPLLLLANFHLRQGDPELAEPLFRKLTEVEPSFNSWAALAGFLARENRDEEAEAAYRKAQELADEEQVSISHRVLASFYYARERFDEAESVLQAALDKRPGDLDLIYVLARFYAARGESDRADAMIEEATRAQPDDVRPYLVLSAYRGRQNDLPGALAAAEQALDVDPESRPAKLRKAELLLDIGYRNDDTAKIAQGRSIVNAVLSKDPSSPEALFVRAKTHLAEAAPAEAITDLRRAIDLKPDWAEAHYMLGSALFVQRDLNAARVEVARALEIDGQMVEARKILARIHAALGDHELAVEAADKVLEQQEDRTTRLLVAQSLVRLGRNDEAKEILESIPAGEQSGETLYALGRIQVIEGDAVKARDYFERANAALPHQADILDALLQLDLRERRAEESLNRISAAVEAQPEASKLKHLQGLTYLVLGRGSDAENAFRRAIELDPNALAAYQSLAQYLARSGRREEVLATYEKAAAQRPDAAGLQLVMGSLYEAYGDTDKAVEHYEKAIAIDPNLAPAKNNMAYILAESETNLDRALDLAQEAKRLLPDNGHVADTLGWVLYKKGVPQAALGYLKEAESLFRPDDPNLGVVRHHLALAYEANGEPERAREALEKGIADVEALRNAYRDRTGQEPGKPAWLTEMQTMLERIEGPEGAGPASAAAGAEG